MNEYLGTISVPAIAVAVYFVIKLITFAVGENVKFEKFVPLISAALGVVFGIVCFYAMPSIIPATNVVVAIVIGAASGFTSIGTDYMLKQFKKTDKTINETPEAKTSDDQTTDDSPTDGDAKS